MPRAAKVTQLAKWRVVVERTVVTQTTVEVMAAEGDEEAAMDAAITRVENCPEGHLWGPADGEGPDDEEDDEDEISEFEAISAEEL